MNARYYVPNTNRMLSPDTIVPNPANPQSFNRYSYAYNNPINFIDPDGHNPVCNRSGSVCSDDLGPEIPVIPELDAHYSIQTPHNLLYPNSPSLSLNLIIMPEGMPANVNADNIHLPYGWDPQEVSRYLGMLGAGLDLTEMILTFTAPQVAFGVGIADAFVAGGACYTAGECYYNQPHPDLPRMLVINQDLALNALDAILVGMVPNCGSDRY